jgi:CRP-like cAMP-binding protein
LSTDNLILKSLPAGVRTILEQQLTPVDMPQSLILQEAGRPVSQVYFPLAGMVSLVTVTPSGESIEAGIVGREGVVGGLAVGGLTSFAQAIVQIEGRGLRIGAPQFRALCHEHSELRDAVDRYQAFILSQAQQNAACHALHSLEGRLCRWLLQSEDLIESSQIALTQEFLSYMLGVRRPTVSARHDQCHRPGLIARPDAIFPH